MKTVSDFSHAHFMQRCLDLAKKGLGNTLSNPLVGSVVVFNGEIIGEGYHRKFGENHAEVNAINSVKVKALLKESTLYVNLEPCSHSGKTPPCTDLILKSGIPRVVIGTIDSSSKSAGKGITMLRNSGCKVSVGILEDESRFLNRRFFTFHEKKRPYIILKWAQTADGFIDIKRDADTAIGPTWISGPYERILVHKWRSEEQAILVGTKTVEIDDPALSVRDWSGNSPIKLVIDHTLKLNINNKIFKDPSQLIIFTALQQKDNSAFKTEVIDFHAPVWPQIMNCLFKMDIVSVLVEGGGKTLDSLISSEFWDEARVFTGNKKIREGLVAPRMEIQCNHSYRTWQSDLKIYYR